ncbi:hypothetical protein [Sporomusa acidovorans]|uniref:hypothetical protein n=1 Tax=Sporomusa acidovorans TaxID=112900 RepID=UPI0035A176D9
MLFAPGSQVNVGGGQVASTLNLSDSDFLSGNTVFAKDGSVINQGHITATNEAMLIAAKAVNERTVHCHRQK